MTFLPRSYACADGSRMIIAVHWGHGAGTWLDMLLTPFGVISLTHLRKT